MTKYGFVHVANTDELKEKGRVVVLGGCSDVINTYTGHHEVNTFTSFYPYCILTTPLDNVIVVDFYTNCFQILNSTGGLLTFYDPQNLGIELAWSLA